MDIPGRVSVRKNGLDRMIGDACRTLLSGIRWAEEMKDPISMS